MTYTKTTVRLRADQVLTGHFLADEREVVATTRQPTLLGDVVLLGLEGGRTRVAPADRQVELIGVDF